MERLRCRDDFGHAALLPLQKKIRVFSLHGLCRGFFQGEGRHSPSHVTLSLLRPFPSLFAIQSPGDRRRPTRCVRRCFRARDCVVCTRRLHPAACWHSGRPCPGSPVPITVENSPLRFPCSGHSLSPKRRSVRRQIREWRCCRSLCSRAPARTPAFPSTAPRGPRTLRRERRGVGGGGPVARLRAPPASEVANQTKTRPRRG